MTTIINSSLTPEVQAAATTGAQRQVVRTATSAVDAIQPISNMSKNEVPLRMMMEFIKASINQQPVNPSIFKGRSYEDWVRMHNLSGEQAVAALVYDGIKNSPELSIPEDVFESLKEHGEYAERYHGMTEKKLRIFTNYTAAHGIDTVQMKGIGYSMNYPNPTARFGGDIDCVNFKHGADVTAPENNMSIALDKLAKKTGLIVENHGEKHSMIILKGMPIENHRYFLNGESGPLPNRLNQYLFKVLNPQQQTLPHGTKILVPSKEFNTVFIPFHALQHFIGRGINTKHLTDWAVHLNKNGLEIPQEVKGTEFEKFIYAFTNVANKYLGTNVNVPKNPELETQIINKMLNPDITLAGRTLPKTKNPIKIFMHKVAGLNESRFLYAKYFEAPQKSLASVVFSSVIKHLKEPKTILRVFRSV